MKDIDHRDSRMAQSMEAR